MAVARGDQERKTFHPADYPADLSHRVRMRIVFWLLLTGFAAVCVNLIDVQVTPDIPLNANTGHVDIEIPRGNVYDCGGSVLASDRLAPSLWANPSAVTDPGSLARRLSADLDLPEDMLFERLTRRIASGEQKGQKMQFVWVKRWLTKHETDRLAAAGLLDGAELSVRDEFQRYYPEEDLAAHVLGFVNQEGVGGGGLEASFDSYLRSTPGLYRTRVDAKRRFLASLTLERRLPEGGHDVRLTISKPIQHILERELEAALAETQAPRAMGLLMDPQTGAILALACVPAFNPNRYTDYPEDLRKNRAVTDVFEPGSAFKVVVASAAIEEGLITPETRIDCEGGVFNPYGKRISDFHKHDFKPDIIPFSRAFAESSNIGIIKVGALLGKERLAEWIDAFGFGYRTSSDFASESRGIVHPLSSWSRLSMGSLPMGQEIAVTMPQLARAYSVVANGGYLVEPYLVEQVVSKDQHVIYKHEPAGRRRILSEETARIMRDLCHKVVVDEHGTGWRASIPEFRVGGKTGTAQVAKPGGGGYYDDKYTSVFAGFAPVADPRICAVIVVQEAARGWHYGGRACGPIFKKVVREALVHLNCPEDPIEGYVPEEAPQPIRVAAAETAAAPPEEQDADTVVKRLPGEIREPTSEEILADLDGLELIVLHTDSPDGGPTLPDLIGMTRRQATSELARLGLNWDARGSGWVTQQEPPAGTPVADIILCRLMLSNRQSLPVAAEDPRKEAQSSDDAV